MAKKRSAGLLLYRMHGEVLQVFLVHPGGPYWAGKNLGSWSIPKGEYLEGEDPLTAAQREFQEETSFLAPSPFCPLGSVRQASGKLVLAWASLGDCDPATLVSNRCEIEWPPRSGKKIDIPEVDRGAWFPIADARAHILLAQQPFLDRLQALLAPAS